MRQRPFRLHHIALLNAVMQSGTLTEAARRLHISQPAVSKQIKQLQQDLGFALFERRGHKLVHTFEAGAMADQILRVNTSLAVLNKLAGELANERRGHLQVGSIAAAASHLLPKALGAILEKNREVELSVRTGNTAQVIEWVETQQVDLGLGLKVRGGEEEIGFTPLADLSIEALLPHNHPLARKKRLSPRDLAGQAVIAVTLPELEWPDGAQLTSEDLGIPVRVRVDTSGVACRMVHAGLGIAVGDSLTLAAFAGGNLVRRPIERAPRSVLGVYRPKLRPNSLLLEDVLKRLKESAREVEQSPSRVQPR
jgi:DNA-binding transcriptional LysR family regulator